MKSGAEKSMFNTCALLQKHGNQIIPFTMENENNIETEYSKYFVKGIEYENEIKKNILRKAYLWFKIIYSLEAKNKISKLIMDTKPDIAHIHKFNNTLTPSILYALRKKDVPVVQTLRDYRTVCPNYNMYDFNRGEVCEDCKGHRYFNAVRRKCQKSSYLIGLNIAVESYLCHFLKTYEKTIDLFISPSNFLMQKMIEFGINRNKIVHIPNFVRVERFVPNYNNSNYTLYFGRIERHKGIRTLVDAMKYVTCGKLYVVGDGSYKKELEEYTKNNNIEHIHFLGFKSGEDLIEIVKESLFTVIPSEWYENCPRSVLESFALAKPVIGANIGGIPELINDGCDGMLFESGNIGDLAKKINCLFKNRNTVIKMGKNARQKIEKKYNENIHYEKLMEAYRRVLRRK